MTKEPSLCPMEEVVNDLLDPIAEWAITGTRPEYELDQIIEDGIVGVIAAVVAGGGSKVVNKVGQGLTNLVSDATADKLLLERTTVDFLRRKGDLKLNKNMTQEQKRAALRQAVENVVHKKTASTPETEDIKYNSHEIEIIKREGKTFRNIIAGLDSSVSEFFQKWQLGRKAYQGEKLEKLYLGKMDEETCQTVSAILGYKVEGRDFIITNDDVKHIFDEHGDPTFELQRGNLPLETWVFESLQEVLESPDSIQPGALGKGKKNNGKRGVVFSKTFPNGKVICIQFDNKGRETMEITTLYVVKKEALSPR